MTKAAALSPPTLPARRPRNAPLARVAMSATGPDAGDALVGARQELATISPTKGNKPREYMPIAFRNDWASV
jgi:hypothetical protein